MLSRSYNISIVQTELKLNNKWLSKNKKTIFLHDIVLLYLYNHKFEKNKLRFRNRGPLGHPDVKKKQKTLRRTWWTGGESSSRWAGTFSVIHHSRKARLTGGFGCRYCCRYFHTWWVQSQVGLFMSTLTKTVSVEQKAVHAGE